LIPHFQDVDVIGRESTWFAKSLAEQSHLSSLRAAMKQTPELRNYEFKVAANYR
jgi:hypothetical protein